jgi:hypothetical protein
MINTIAEEISIQEISAPLNLGISFYATGVSGKSVPEKRQSRLRPSKITSKIHFLISILLKF